MKEKQIKTVMSYHSTPGKMAIIKKKEAKEKRKREQGRAVGEHVGKTLEHY
jgi:hypothetical protein